MSLFIAGVPAAGHVTDRGFWHPGRPEGCVKCEPAEESTRPVRNGPGAPRHLPTPPKEHR